MRRTKFLFTLCSFLLFAMTANGALLLMRSRDVRPGPEPVPIAYYKDDSAVRMDFQQTQQRDADDEMPVNLLVLGLDDEETRSDVILLFNYKPGTTGLNILSVARDTLVHSGGKSCKINALYSKGGELLVADKVSQLTRLPVHYYVTVNLRGFRKIVDILGGVRFDVPFRMNYDDPTQKLHIHLKKGMQLLDGKQAEQLVRYRKGNYKRQGYTDGDIGRIKMQQAFIKALIDQKLNLGYISNADELFGVLRTHVKTNLEFSDIARYSGSLLKMNSGEIHAVTLPGTSRMIDGAWYLIADEEEARRVIDESFYK
jgi:LCP family protein required for cell wall assembly